MRGRRTAKAVLALVMASGVSVEGAGLRVGMAGGRSVIGNASQWGRGAEVAASAIGGQKTAAMEGRRAKPHGLKRGFQLDGQAPRGFPSV